jgi:hypothetical protein
MYWKIICSNMPLYGENYFCFQQDTAQSHKIKRTHKWLEDNLPDSLTPSNWPTSLPDLNLLNCLA